MPIQKSFKPEEMFVPGFMAESHYFADCIRHFHLISKGVGLRKFFLYQVNRKKQLVLLNQAFVQINISCLSYNFISPEDFTWFFYDLSLFTLAIFFFPCAIQSICPFSRLTITVAYSCPSCNLNSSMPKNRACSSGAMCLKPGCDKMLVRLERERLISRCMAAWTEISVLQNQLYRHLSLFYFKHTKKVIEPEFLLIFFLNWEAFFSDCSCAATGVLLQIKLPAFQSFTNSSMEAASFVSRKTSRTFSSRQQKNPRREFFVDQSGVG